MVKLYLDHISSVVFINKVLKIKLENITFDWWTDLKQTPSPLKTQSNLQIASEVDLT